MTELKDITLALKIRFNKEFTDINLCAHFLLDLEQLLQVLYLSVTVIWQKRKKKLVLSTYKWYTTRMLVLPFAKRMHVCCTTIVRCKNSSNRHETLHVATCLQITPYVTHSTGISNVSLSYVVLTIITMLLLFRTREPKHFVAFSFRKLKKKILHPSFWRP